MDFSASSLFQLCDLLQVVPFRYHDYTCLHQFKPRGFVDGLVLVVVLLISLGYLTRGRIWDKTDSYYHVYFEKPQIADQTNPTTAHTTRDISKRLHEGDYHAVIFWGSQSGTSERLAEALRHEAHAHFGFRALVADLSDYDAESISAIQRSNIAIFLLSTFGEGDPSDNTTGLWNWIKRSQDQDTRLPNLKYFAFGLGNSNYKYYNRVLDVVCDALDAAGATAIIPRQRADDAKGGTEEDFQAWKETVFSLFRDLGYKEKAVTYTANLEIEFVAEDKATSQTDAPISVHHQSTTNSAIVPMAVRTSRELFAKGDRNCVHLELDLGDSEVVYKTGDHVGIWPCNPLEEVERLLNALGQSEHRHSLIKVTSQDDSIKVKLPSPVSLYAAFSYYLEICGPVTRNTVLDLVQFAPTPEAQETVKGLGQDRAKFEHLTSTTHITLARLLQWTSPNQPWSSLPLSFVIEKLLALQPRYYSISSSSVISPRRIAITALVVNKALSENETQADVIQGLTSNYLLHTSDLASRSHIPTPTYQRPTEASSGIKESTIFAHVRKSKFKLPTMPSTPIILIGAGTGFAPFRAFLQERTKLHALGKPIGKILLFMGCRNEEEYIYHEEIEQIQAKLRDKIEVVTAFSRSSAQPRTYVQSSVSQHAETVLHLLDAGANLYICGKASMAREVNGELEEAAKRTKGWSVVETQAWTDSLKKRGKWKTDVWG